LWLLLLGLLWDHTITRTSKKFPAVRYEALAIHTYDTKTVETAQRADRAK
jgi:hypothetical protein